MKQLLCGITALATVLVLGGCSKPQTNVLTQSDGANGCDISNYDIYEEYKTASATYLCEGDTTFGADVKVYTTAAIAVQWPRRFGDADVKALQDTIIAHTFSTPKASIDSCIVDFISKPVGYGESVLRRVDAVPDEGPDKVRELFNSVEVKSVGFCEEFVVFRVYHSQYLGGAHGSYFTSYVNYDLKNKRVLTFNSLFKPNSDEALMPILKDTLLRNYYAETMSELEEKSGIFVDDLFVSHVIYLTGSEVVFVYNPYDIGPWAIGTVEIPVFVADLADCLTDYGKALFKMTE
ncbi:MAG: RsiV family protein [Muribaculaceae bacterium]